MLVLVFLARGSQKSRVFACALATVCRFLYTLNGPEWDEIHTDAFLGMIRTGATKRYATPVGKYPEIPSTSHMWYFAFTVVQFLVIFQIIISVACGAAVTLLNQAEQRTDGALVCTGAQPPSACGHCVVSIFVCGMHGRLL